LVAGSHTPVAAGDRDVNDDVVAIDNEVPYLPMPVRKCGARRRELHRQAAASIGAPLTLMVDV
jgi:hypothetical protein